MAFTLRIGDPAPDFRHLPAAEGKACSLADFHDTRVLVVAFTCNHCPYVIGSEDRMVAFCLKYAPKGVKMAAINSNEAENHPTDSLPHMVERARAKNFPFTYLRDESQAVAMAYGALRTPHFYAFDKDPHRSHDPLGGWRLRYTGRMDDNPGTPGAETTHELADAVDALLEGRTPPVEVTNPIGCNVKWKGKPAKWMPPEACDLV